jgi:hypothetical protein
MGTRTPDVRDRISMAYNSGDTRAILSSEHFRLQYTTSSSPRGGRRGCALEHLADDGGEVVVHPALGRRAHSCALRADPVALAPVMAEARLGCRACRRSKAEPPKPLEGGRYRGRVLPDEALPDAADLERDVEDVRGVTHVLEPLHVFGAQRLVPTSDSVDPRDEPVLDVILQREDHFQYGVGPRPLREFSQCYSADRGKAPHSRELKHGNPRVQV